jgi:hypothetical protein
MTGILHLARRRLVAQGVVGPRHPDVESAAKAMLATQAQDFHGAKWALALRSTRSEIDVDAALADGRVIRTWPMRGTLLFVARPDARWLTELLAPRSFLASAGVWRGAGLEESDFDRARAVAGDVLAGGVALGRAPLLRSMESAGVETGGGRGAHLLRRLAGDTTIAFGPPRGTEQTFVLLDEWAPDAVRLERDEALAELATRYVSGHGPATVRDLAWWSGSTLTEARRAVALAGDRVALDRDGYLIPATAADPPSHEEAPRGDVRLLPGFDELLLGYRDRSASLAPEHAPLVVPSSNGLFLPSVVVDGRVAGVWRRSLPSGRGAVSVTVELFSGVPAVVTTEIRRRADDYARYLGRALDLTIVP